MHGKAFALTHSKPMGDANQEELWVQANKVCRHGLISHLSNDLFYVDVVSH